MADIFITSLITLVEVRKFSQPHAVSQSHLVCHNNSYLSPAL
jgi:hypothetical protein